ncbi:MAG: VWA domain-containing protein [Planctomycetota bacterium]|nr:VWA domain-containing protein [Planctomycetota bacterium]
MAFKFRCAKCGKRLTVNESPGTEVACPHCNQATVVPSDAQPTEVPGTVAAVAPEPAAVAAGAAPPANAAPPPEGEQPEEEEQGGMDTVMAWLAMYVPSWGTSVLLHLAVVILAYFTAWQVEATQPPFEYKSAVVQTEKHKMEKRLKPDQKQQSSRGKFRPGPSSIVRKFTDNPLPDVADNNLAQLEVLGIGGGGGKIGGFEGLGSGRGNFFGAGGDDESAKIVYVVDRSGSMTDSLDFVKYELKRSIGELGEAKEFHVIFYSSGPPVEMSTRRLVNATERNRQLAFEFIDGVIAQGETDPSKALERAFDCKPELIYLLTDGEFDRAIIDHVKRLNVGGKATVHTIGFLYKTGEAVLKQIADDNHGNYKFISESDLATLAQQN